MLDLVLKERKKTITVCIIETFVDKYLTPHRVSAKPKGPKQSKIRSEWESIIANRFIELEIERNGLKSEVSVDKNQKFFSNEVLITLAR